jgi:acid-sensing ion channel, other
VQDKPFEASSRSGSGLEMKLWNNYNVAKHDTFCQLNAFSVHSPDQFALKTHTFGYGNSLEIMITPSIIQTDESLRSTPPKIRKCLFREERKLRYYKYYTRAACELECKSHLFYELCGCTSFFWPRNDSMKLCNIPGMDCHYDNRNIDLSDYDHMYQSEGVCGCLDECNSIKYEIEMNAVKYDLKHNMR